MGEVIIDAIISGIVALRTDSFILIAASFSSIFPYGVLATLFLYKLKVTNDSAALLCGGLCGGLLFDAPLSFVILWVSPSEWAIWLFVLLMGIGWGVDIVLWIRWRFVFQPGWSFWGLIALMPVLLVFKLAFVVNLPLPLHTDSVEHHTIIQDISNTSVAPRSFYNPGDFPDVIYHYGYHSLVAKQYLLTRADLGRVMLDFGQLLLVVGAIGMYFPAFLLTKSKLAGWVAVISTGFVWIMPAYAVNWGKYPAITAFSLFPYVLGLFIFAVQRRWREIPQGFYFILGGSALSIIFIHTRMAVILLLLLAASVFASMLRCQPRVLLTINLGIILLLCIFVIFQIDFTTSIFEIYWRYGNAQLFVALFASIISAIKAPRLSMACLLMLCLSILATNLAMPKGLEKYIALIDRPFFQIGFYHLLALFTGFGLAEFNKLNLWSEGQRVTSVFILLVCVLLISSAPLINLLVPSTCCNWVGEGDKVAYYWIQSSTGSMERVLIAAAPQQFDMRATDGGAWIENLAHRSSVKIDHNYDFGSLGNQESLCQRNIHYIYVGNQQYSFRDQTLQAHPSWYLEVLQVPGVHIYKILCAK